MPLHSTTGWRNWGKRHGTTCHRSDSSVMHSIRWSDGGVKRSTNDRASAGHDVSQHMHDPGWYQKFVRSIRDGSLGRDSVASTTNVAMTVSHVASTAKAASGVAMAVTSAWRA